MGYHSQSVSHKVFWGLVIAAAAITPSTILAKKIVVGGDKGWTVGVNYQQDWVKDNEFHVGDELVFNYPEGAHNVYKVSKSEFDSCNVGSGKGYFTGRDTIPLDSIGESWYICGLGNHCESGQKLVVDVKQS